MSTEPGSSAEPADTQPPCPAHQDRLFYCLEGGTRNIVYGSSLAVLKKGVIGEIDPTTKLRRP